MIERCPAFDDDARQCVKVAGHPWGCTFPSSRVKMVERERCRTTKVTMAGTVLRCIDDIHERSESGCCAFDARPSHVQDVCHFRQINFSTQRMRLCAMPAGHGGIHVYDPDTERVATREDMRLPPIPATYRG